MIELRLPFPTPSLNTVNKEHWGKEHKRKRTMKEYLRLEFLSKYNVYDRNHAMGRMKKRVLIHVHHGGSVDRDYDNVVGGCKGLLDVLKKMNLIVDDSPLWLEGGKAEYTWERGKKPYFTNIKVEEV